jgi:predicted nucleic acid-binding protein
MRCDAAAVVIFVDTNVFMYAVGRDHQLRTPARDFFEHSVKHNARLVTSAEAMQELLHAYLPVGRVRRWTPR